MTQRVDRPNRLYGRKRGHPLSPHQQKRMETLGAALAVPGDRISDSAALFRTAGPIHMEIGFGGGEHLIDEATGNPGLNFIGIEPFENGMANLLFEVEQQGLSNIRTALEDARDVLDRLPDQCLDRVWLLYPDPWPKKRHWKRRFISDGNLSALARCLRDGAEFRFASDIDTYLSWTLAHVRRHPDFEWLADSAADWRTPWEGWKSTRYEEKAFREGRKGHYLTFRRIPRPASQRP